ncbi:MAG: hypothetical protein HOJ35_08865 [Bdellovibrionales bacterium]|jgi:hypothetical protein|nr:hypothetical protein [Bdellovibrionales bacterium]
MNLFYKLQQVIIFLIHIFLLVWIIFILKNASIYSTKEITFHFMGMAIYGATLIYGTAQWAKRHHLKSLQNSTNND